MQAEKVKRAGWAPSLKTKFMLAIAVMTCVITAGVMAITYVSYKDANLEKFRSSVASCVKLGHSLTDGDSIERYIKTGASDADYETLVGELTNIRDFYNLEYLYVFLPNVFSDTELSNYYIIDLTGEGNGADNGDGTIGYKEELDFATKDTDKSIAIAQNILTTGEGNLELNISESVNGHLASAFMPVKNSAGEVVAILGADVTVETVYQDLLKIILMIFGVVLVIALISAFILTMYVSSHMLVPLQKLVDSTQNFVEDNYRSEGKAREPLVINTRDELERLCDAFNKMTGDIQQYITEVTSLTNERERIAAELAVAAKIQVSVLPTDFAIAPSPGDFELYATMDPAKQVGGDLYDFFMLDDNRLCFMIGDVSGKGVPAALFMMMAKSIIHENLIRYSSMSEAFEISNRMICDGNEEGMFVTVLCLILEVDTGRISIVDAGHGQPVRIAEGGSMEWLKTKRGFVMGGLEGVKYRVCENQLNPGDTVFLFTDGVSEADNLDHELYGNERIEKSVARFGGGGITEMLTGIREDLRTFACGAPQADDITMVAMRYKPTKDA